MTKFWQCHVAPNGSEHHAEFILVVVVVVVVGLLPSREAMAAPGLVMSGCCTSSYGCVGQCGSGSLCRTDSRCGLSLHVLLGVDLRATLFILWQSVRSCSACFVPECTAARQESGDSTRLSLSIAEHCMSLLHVSL